MQEEKQSGINRLNWCTQLKLPKQRSKVDLRMEYFDVDKVLDIEDTFNYWGKM